MKEHKECLLCPVCFNLLKISDFENASQAAKSQGLQVRCKCGNGSLVKFGLDELHVKVLSLAEKVSQMLKPANQPVEAAPKKG